MKLSNDLDPTPQLQPGEDFEVKWLSASDALRSFTYDDAKDAVKLAYLIY